MRVTHVITRLIVGGAQENTIATVLGLHQRREIQVQLISGPTTGPEGSLESAFLHSPGLLSLLPELVRPIHPWYDFIALNKLTRMFRADHPQIVHTHSGKAGILGRLAAARAEVPIIVHTIHGPSFGQFQSAPANVLFRAAERHAAKVTSHFVVVADAMKQQYLAAGIGRPQHYSKTLSGFDLTPFSAARNDEQQRARWGIQPNEIVIGKIARLFKLKGHDDLFEIAPELVRRCPRAKFLLVGDGEWRSRFENKARSLGLEKSFVFTGLLLPQQLPELFGIMDIVIHLSRREGLPRVLPQALAAARPVVAYDCDGAREACLDQQTGLLIQAGDLKGLTESILRLANDEKLRREFGARGQTFVRENFGVEQMVENIYLLYRKLAARRGLQTA
jgi:glycosyltransferase involved in cell wall biosynthesis